MSKPAPIHQISPNPNFLPSCGMDDDDYVTRTLRSREILPPVTWQNWRQNIQWSHFLILLSTTALAFLGPIFVQWCWKTILFCIVYLSLLAFSITAGYHRLWSHNSYNGSTALQYLLAILAAGAGQHDIEWWCARHRAHHRYTDTALDPYNAKMGFFWTLDWETFKQQSLERPLILIAGFIHDISDFIDDHPGGADLLLGKVGKDATTAFFGGFYNHSNSAHNLLSMKRVGALHGGVQCGLDEKSVPPSLRLRIMRYNEQAHSL